MMSLTQCVSDEFRLWNMATVDEFDGDFDDTSIYIRHERISSIVIRELNKKIVELEALLSIKILYEIINWKFEAMNPATQNVISNYWLRIEIEFRR